MGPKVRLTSGFHELIGYAASYRNRDTGESRTPPGNDPGGAAQYRLSQFCETRVGGLQSAGLRLLKKAWTQIKDDIDESGIDRQELLSWSIQTLMAAAGQAMQQKNPGAVVSAIRQLDHMTGTGYNSHRGYGINRRKC